MYPDHPYNVASRKVNDNFLGASQMMVVVEGKVKEAIKNEDVLRAMEEFQWHMEQEGGATGSDSATSLLKRVFRMFHEGDPNWEVLPLNRSDIGSTFFVVTTFMASNEVGRLYSHDYQNAIVTLYYRTIPTEWPNTPCLPQRILLTPTPRRRSTFAWQAA